MRKLYFLLPGTDSKFACGGLWAELKTMNLAQKICSAEVVTYRQREEGKLFLDDVLQQKKLDDVIFIICWGFDIAKLVPKLASCNVIYHAHSAGYNFTIPSSIPIITVSRNSMGYWGQMSPHSLIYYLPNEISPEFINLNSTRDIDVLIQARKSSEYLMRELIPNLQQKRNVFIVNSYVKDLTELFNRAKVYLYDSAEYWAVRNVSEGFGLQPMEALACGCQVFSSVNGGLSDYLDPGFNSYKIACYSQEYDVKRILKVLDNWAPAVLSSEFLSEYREENIVQRFQIILDEINDFFDHAKNQQSNIQSLTKMRVAKLRVGSALNKVKNKCFK
jgi:glycosyltransferase involved in cell wall biosynthesis